MQAQAVVGAGGVGGGEELQQVQAVVGARGWGGGEELPAK